MARQQTKINFTNSTCHVKLDHAIDCLEQAMESFHRKRYTAKETLLIADALTTLRTLSSTIDTLAGHGEQYETFYLNYMKELEKIAEQPHD